MTDSTPTTAAQHEHEWRDTGFATVEDCECGATRSGEFITEPATAAGRLDYWLPALTAMSSPKSQHFMFLRRVLHEPVVDALVMAHFLAKDGLMDEREMRHIAERWHADAA